MDTSNHPQEGDFGTSRMFLLGRILHLSEGEAMETWLVYFPRPNLKPLLRHVLSKKHALSFHATLLGCLC